MPKRCYLADPELAKTSAHHTAYAGTGAVTEDGKPGPLYKLEFDHGVARDVDDALYQRFKDVGVAADKRPTVARDDD